MSSIDAESTSLVSAAVVPSVADPLGGVVFFAGLAMGVVMFIASRTFRRRRSPAAVIEPAAPATGRRSEPAKHRTAA